MGDWIQEEEQLTFVHIGYHKSASTYLQKFVFPQLPYNYLYLSGNKRRVLDLVISGTNFDTDDLNRWIHKKISESPNAYEMERTILSNEELSGHPHGYTHSGNDPYITARNIKTAFPAAKILIVIRSQFDYMLSLYAFRVAIKGEETRGLRRFIAEEGRSGLFEKLKYDRLVAHYVSLFEKKNVMLLPVEQLKNDPYLFHRNLADFFNVSRIRFTRNRLVNKSTKSEIILNCWRPINCLFSQFLNLLYLVNISKDQQTHYFRLRYKFYRFKRRMTKQLNRVFNTEPIVTIPGNYFQENLYDSYADSNQALEELYASNLRSYGYPFKMS